MYWNPHPNAILPRAEYNPVMSRVSPRLQTRSRLPKIPKIPDVGGLWQDLMLARQCRVRTGKMLDDV